MSDNQTLFSPRAQNKFKLSNSIELEKGIDLVWKEISDLSNLSKILHPDCTLKVNGQNKKDLTVSLTDDKNITWSLKVFELNEEKRKLSYIILGSNYMFSTYKCTLSLSGDEKKCTVSFLEVGRCQGEQEYEDAAKKRLELLKIFFEK